MDWTKGPGWIFKGRYPANVIWAFIQQTYDEDEFTRFQFIIVFTNRAYAEGYRPSLVAAKAAVTEHLERIINR